MSHQPPTKTWINAVAEFMGISPSELAKKAGLAPSTVTRYLYDKSGTLGVRDATLDAIASFSGVPKLVMPGQKGVPGLRSSELVAFKDSPRAEQPKWVGHAVDGHVGSANGIEAFVMNSRALDLLGILPGDVVMVDHNRRPKSGDIVCAILRDLATGSEELVLRRYEPPFLLTYSTRMEPARPEQVDDERVVIVGVENGLIRPRH